MEFFWTKSHVAIVVVGTQAKYISLWMVENKNILFMLNLLCRECHHVFVVCCKVPYISQSWFKTRNMKMFSTIRLVTQLRQWYINRVLPWNDDHGCWAASRLFRHQESPGRAFHGDVNGLDIGGQHGRRLVLRWKWAAELFSDTRNRVTDDLSAACVALKLTKYEPRLDKLSASMQQQKPHCSIACQMKTFTFQ